MSAWQPIETAPKDGTDIIVYCGPSCDPMYGIAHWSEAVDAVYAEGQSAETKQEMTRAGWVMWWQADAMKHQWPTHWRPIPDGPSY